MTENPYPLDRTPLITQADLERRYQWSNTLIGRFVDQDILTPQRLTLRGSALFEPDYIRWIEANVPRFINRVSELGLTVFSP